MGWYAMERARERIADLASRGLDATTFFLEAGQAIVRAVPSAGPPCWTTIDPATLLATSYYDPQNAAGEVEFVEWAYGDEQWTPVADLAHSPAGFLVYGRHAASAAERRHAPELEACGAQQVLLLALRSRTGETWGSIDLWRARGQAEFAPDEVAFLRHISGQLTEGVQRGLLVGEALDPEGADVPGLLVLNSRCEVESATTGAEHWLADLPGRWREDASLPTVVASVAARALQTITEHGGDQAMARVRSRSGRWLVVHGTVLATGGRRRRVAVILEPAHPARISPLLMAAFGLTTREQEIARMVLSGSSTSDIAAELAVSPHTVQQHLKSVFEKIGVRSRRELVSRIFLSHYEPRVEDNGDRVRSGRPIRGGPMARPSPPAGQAGVGVGSASAMTPS